MYVGPVHAIVVVLAVTSVVSQYEGYFQWTPTVSKRTDLYCPETCKNGTNEVEECCACEAIACWESDPTLAPCDVNADYLHLEYTDIFGSSLLLQSPYAVSITHFKFSHTSGRMRTLPVNICDFPNLLLIEAAYNYIYVIGNISCLHELNILDLSNNEIQTLSNTTFSVLTNLRVLKLAYNKIDVLDANSLNLAVGSIFHVDLAGNPLYELDITNVVSPGEMCLRNFSNVKATDLKNDNNYKLNTSDGAPIYGPGFVDFSSSNIGYSANFTTLGISYTELSRYLQVGFTFVNSQINCDCALVPLLKNIYYPQNLVILPDLLDNMTCLAPPHRRGFLITKFYDNVTLDSLTCDIIENCPKGPKRDCTCTDKQNQGVMVVNCTDAGLEALPSNMPVGFWNNKQLDLILDGNDITQFTNTEYLERVQTISLKDNPIREIQETTFDNLPEQALIDLSAMDITSLPYNIRKVNPNQIKFSSKPFKCDCSQVWVGDWLRSHSAVGVLMCELNGQVIEAETITRDIVGCETETPNTLWKYLLGIASLVLFIVIASAIVYAFSQEVFILRRRISCRESPYKNYQYDVFISVDETYDIPTWNVSMQRWLLKTVKPQLEQSGLSVFVPFTDIPAGENRNDQVQMAIDDSRIYVIILTEYYLTEVMTLFEFDLIWKQYRKYQDKNILLINYEYQSASEVQDSRMKAILRVGTSLDFSDTTEQMIKRIKNHLRSAGVVQTTIAWNRD